MTERPEVRYRIIWKWWAIVLGMFVDLAIEVLLQQFGVQTLEWSGLLLGMGRGALIGFLAPNLGAAVGTFLARRELRQVEVES